MADNTPINKAPTPANTAQNNGLNADLDKMTAAQAAAYSEELNAIAPAAGNPFAQQQNVNSGNAVNTASGTLASTGLASHTLVKPAAGQSQTIAVSSGEIISAQFDPNSANLSMSGKDLVMSFNDGSQIILQGFASDISNMPSISLPGGALVSGGIIVAQLQGTNEDIFNLETAANAGAGGSGNFIYSDDLGGVIGLLDKLPPILFSSLEFTQPQVQVTIADDLPAAPPSPTPPIGGSFVPNITTTITNPDGSTQIVAGGFEDWQANQHIGDFTITPMTLQIVFTPQTNEVVDQVTISNIPNGVQFFYLDANGNTVPLTITNGSLTLSGADIASGNILILPAGNTDADIPFTISLFIRNPDTGETAILAQNVLAVVDAVADMPTLDTAISIGGQTVTSGTITAEEGNNVQLNLNTTFPDNDGSEVHTVIIQGVPADWTLVDSQGLTFTTTIAADGTITYTAVVTGDVNNTITFNPNNWSSQDHGTAQITVISTTTESVTDGELTLDNNTATIENTFGININESVPTLVAVTDPALIPEASLLVPGTDQVGGTITVDFGNDGPGGVTLTTDGLDNLGLTSDGEPLTYTLSPDGSTITATTPGGTPIFTVEITPGTTPGEYEYTFTLEGPLDHEPGNGNNHLNIPINFVVTDSDGDTVSGTIPVIVVDDVPEAGNIATGVDETTTLGQVFTGTVPVDFGADGPAENDALVLSDFNATGSLPNGGLTSGGVPVVVTLVNGQYIGTANGTPVFTMTLDPQTGEYTFVQHGPLDHADGSNPNDVISLNFEYTATDNDGDSVTSTITINVRDDAPIAIDDVRNITDDAPQVTGNVMDNDTMSNDGPNTLQNVSVGGNTYSFANPTGTDANGPYLTIQGEHGTLTIYQNGQYTYTYTDGNFAGTYTDQFTYTLVDFDGDTDTATLTINIVDNGPDQVPVLTHTIDESFDIGNTISGDIDVAGADSFALTTVTPGGSLSGGSLSSNGVPVTVTLVGGNYVGTANGTPVFTLTLNPQTGEYTFTQHAPLDHADGSNPNDVIDLTFGYTATDGNGNTLDGTITINILDDAPVAVADSNSVTNDAPTATGNVITNDTLSQDDTNTLQSVGFGGTNHSFANPTGTDANGPYLTIQGDHGTLTIYQNGQYTYTYNDNNFTGTYTDQFTYTLVDGDGDTSSTTLTINIVDNGPDQAPVLTHTIDESFDIGNTISGDIDMAGADSFALTSVAPGGSLSGGSLSSNGVPVTITLVGGNYVGTANGTPVFTLTLNPQTGAYTFTQHAPLDHADGSNPNDVIDLTFGYTATDGSGNTAQGTITVHILDDAPLAVDNNYHIMNVPDNVATVDISGNILINDFHSQDGADPYNDILSVSFDGNTYYFSSPTGTDAGGAYLIVQGEYGTLKVYENGQVTYTYYNNNFAGQYVDTFQYTLIDGDGDTSTANIIFTVDDTGPSQIPVITHTIDETTDIGAVISGTINIPGADVTFDLTTAAPGGSLMGGSLTSNGVPVVITLVNGVYVGMANGAPVFTLTLNPQTGAYTFTQHAPLDHADGSNPNDVINLTFGYTATDGSGNVASSTITVSIRDDAPIAVADTNTVPNNSSTASGNVLLNDTMSVDTSNLISNAGFGSNNLSFSSPSGYDANGAFLLIQGTYGLLKLYQNGQYTYTYDNANHTGNHTEVFNYTIRDFDGDTSSTTLTINIVDHGPGVPPEIIRTIDETTDLGLAVTGTINVTQMNPNAITFSLGNDDGAATFNATGSVMGGNLSSHGVPIVVTLVNGQYVGMAGNVTVFTLSLNPQTGQYVFTQYAAIDHANGNNPNDIISLNFTYTITDGDGDSASNSIVIHVRDDAPIAVADVATVSGSNTSVGGDVTANDTLGVDSDTFVVGVSHGSQVVNFGSNDTVTINGQYGQLTIHKDGTYTYNLYSSTTTPGNGSTNTDVFNYTIRDFDGDSSSTTLTITSVTPKLVVGGNDNNTGPGGPGYVEGPGSGTIVGSAGNDILVGDAGGSSANAGEDFNIVMVLDTSASMNQGNKLAQLKAAVLNLLSDFNDYTGGEVKIRFITFNNGVQQEITFTVTNAAGYQNAINFINGLVTGQDYTNYEDPLQHAIAWLNSSNTSSGPIAGATNFTYFISDGTPNRYNNAAGNSVPGSAGQVLNEITGSDGSNEVAQLQNLSTVVAIGVGVTNMDALNAINSNGNAVNLNNPNDLDGTLDQHNPLPDATLAPVGNDTINGGAGDDIIFGDSVNTDILAQNMGVDLPTGSGWSVFEYLEAQHPGWTRDTTINYIRTHLEELARESHNSNGEGRTGGNDTLNGGDGNDFIFGQEGNDTIYGGAGNDVISGGSGNNTLYGGAGSDTFLFIKGSTGHDSIMDYSNAQNDRLDISDLLTGTGYTPGGNAANYVKIDGNTGQVYVDVTGNGNFNSSNHIATINGANSMDTINVILHDNEGVRTIHTV